MASGKWINDISATTPIEDAARRVLSVRMQVVRNFLGLALKEPEKDPEHVHQLRVGTRRSGAALRIFRCCLPSKAYKKCRNELRRLRRAAGAARDWDVFLETLSKESEQKTAKQSRAGLDFLLGYAMGQRLAAQATLTEAVSDPFAFDRVYAETLHAVCTPDEGGKTLIELACPILEERIEAVEAAAETDMNDYENLHQVRINGKRLRYAMEVFAGCFPDEFRKVHYSAVEEMQEILGRANDSHVACARLSHLRDKVRAMIPAEWRRIKPNLEAMIRYHEKRLPAERKHFVDWWNRWQEEGGKSELISQLKTAEEVYVR